MRQTVVSAAASLLLLGAATGAHADDHADDHGGGRVDEPVVVVDGLDNPRQLSWAGDTLLVAEAGSGGECVPLPPSDEEAPAPPEGSPAAELCAGDTGAITAVEHPDLQGNANANANAKRKGNDDASGDDNGNGKGKGKGNGKGNDDINGDDNGNGKGK